MYPELGLELLLWREHSQQLPLGTNMVQQASLLLPLCGYPRARIQLPAYTELVLLPLLLNS